MEKPIRIKEAFIFYTLKIAASFAFIILFGLILFPLAFNLEFVYPANYSEVYINENHATLKKGQDLNKLPYFIDYVYYNKEGEILDKSTDKDLWKAYKERKNYLGKERYLSFIEGDQGVLCFSYPLKVMYQSVSLNRILPKFEVLLFILLPLTFLLIIFLFLRSTIKKIDRSFKKTEKLIEEIKLNSLTIKSQKTDFVDLNELQDVLVKMSLNLKKSLQEKWKLEEEQKMQIQALCHDMGTGIAIAKGNIELLLEEEKDEDKKSAMEDILYAINELEKESQFLLTMEKEKLEEIEVEEFFRQIKKVYFSAGKLSKKELVWKMEIDSKSRILGDRDLLRRAFLNLIQNSLEYSRSFVQVSIFEEEELKIYIKDDGPGFSPEALKRGLSLFFTEDKSRSGSHKGIGLYMAKEAICLSKGKIFLENKEGALVSINIPKIS